MRPFLIPHLHDRRKMEVCLINYNTGDWWELFKIVQYLEMECNCVRIITEGFLRKYSTIWQHKCESPITMLKILLYLAEGPLNFEAIGFRLSSSYVNPALLGVTDCCFAPNELFQLYHSENRLLKVVLKYHKTNTEHKRDSTSLL